ncbi:hypothetical protein LPJ61_002921 [Coemansia biformis]|uniref:HMG box domain-containing protein n=1 Tax=Coemansia biformis TaxID=1286918 RepID=A0A9W8CY71_9FUNG|nr:hypothetical protein LPJ61_002921 [Coemansia biformis]
MDSYHSQFAYAPGPDVAAYMPPLHCPPMGMTPMMGPMHAPPPHVDSFHLPPHHAAPVGVMAGAPAISHVLCSAQIGDSSSPCFLYRHDSISGSTVEQGAQQLCMADGRLFIEHIPNHSLVYIPLSSSIDEVLYSLRMQYAAPPMHDSAVRPHGCQDQAVGTPAPQTHQQKQAQPRQAQPQQPPQQQQQQVPQSQPQPRKPKEKSAKPINAFIKYRSFKIAELKRLYPDVSQTEISRLAGECWKTESEDVKNQFRVQYREEKKVYDMKKATGAIESTKRRREDSEALSDFDAAHTSDGGASTPLLDDGIAPLATLGVPVGFDASCRRRSLTMPPADTGAAMRAVSSSPLMTPQQKRLSSSKRRRCVTSDLRKQLAAKISLLATPPLPAASVSLTRTSTAPAIGRAQSMGLDEHFGGYSHDAHFAAPDFGYYSALALPPPMAADASPYLSDMAPLAFAVPGVSQPLAEPPVLTVDTSFVSVPEDPAGTAFDLYTTASDHDELASSLVSASLVAASLSTLMGSSHSVCAPLDAPVSMVTTAMPLADQSAGNASL